MSQHASLRIDSVGTKHRNVLKRYERVQKIQEQAKWGDRQSAYNLPKVRSMKIKVKKTKEAPADAAAAGAAPPAAGATATPAPAAKAAAKPAAKPAAKTEAKK